MTTLKLLSAAVITATMLAAPAMARESHVTSRHATEQSSADAGYVDGRVCIPAPRVGAFATAPWTGSNVPCEPTSRQF
jgi:hypothetical protein